MGQQNDDLWMGAATGPQTIGWSNGGNPGVIGRGVGPLGRVYIWDIVPAAKSTTAVCNAQAAAAAGNLTINGASATAGVVTFADARAVNVDTNNTANTTQTVTITGTDYYGQSQTEDIACNGTTLVAGQKAFKTVTGVYVDDAITGTIQVGSEDTFGLPYRITNAGYIVHAGWNDTLADDAGTFVAADTTSPATATTGDVRGTYTPSSAADGAKRLVMTLALTALQAGPNATQIAAVGVTPV